MFRDTSKGKAQVRYVFILKFIFLFLKRHASLVGTETALLAA